MTRTGNIYYTAKTFSKCCKSYKMKPSLSLSACVEIAFVQSILLLVFPHISPLKISLWEMQTMKFNRSINHIFLSFRGRVNMAQSKKKRLFATGLERYRVHNILNTLPKNDLNKFERINVYFCFLMIGKLVI